MSEYNFFYSLLVLCQFDKVRSMMMLSRNNVNLIKYLFKILSNLHSVEKLNGTNELLYAINTSARIHIHCTVYTYFTSHGCGFSDK